LIKIVKESGLVSPLDTGTAFLFNGEYLNAAKEYVKAFKQISELVGEDTMEKIFVSVCGQSGKIIWNTGITTLLQIISLPDKYYLLKEIADNYVTNPGPLDGYVMKLYEAELFIMNARDAIGYKSTLIYHLMTNSLNYQISSFHRSLFFKEKLL